MIAALERAGAKPRGAERQVWDNDRLSRDDFIGEVALPLIDLMDARTHSYTMELADPEGKTSAEGGVKGEISFELKYES